MPLHTSHAADMLSRVVIVSPDTDLAVFGVHFAQTIGSELLFKTIVKDLVRCILLHCIAREFGSKIHESILAPHALTGCDSTSYLCGKGKQCAWRIFKKEIGNLEYLNRLEESMTLNPHVYESVNNFIPLLYSPKSDGEVNLLRYKFIARNKQLIKKTSYHTG